MNDFTQFDKMPPPDLSFECAPDLSFKTSPRRVSSKSKTRLCAADENNISQRLRLVTAAKLQLLNANRLAASLDHLKSLPKPGQCVHLVCPGTYTGFDLIAACQQILARPVALTVASLSTSLELTQRMIDLLDAGTFTKIDLILSDFYAKNTAEEFNLIQSRLRARGQRCISCRNHAKISLLCADNPPAFIVLEGSGNVRSCNAIEQVVIFNSKPLYEFHHDWISKLVQRPE